MYYIVDIRDDRIEEEFSTLKEVEEYATENFGYICNYKIIKGIELAMTHSVHVIDD